MGEDEAPSHAESGRRLARRSVLVAFVSGDSPAKNIQTARQPRCATSSDRRDEQADIAMDRARDDEPEYRLIVFPGDRIEGQRRIHGRFTLERIPR